MLLSAVSVLLVAQSSSEIPEGLMNNPVYKRVPEIHTDLPNAYVPSVHMYQLENPSMDFSGI